MEKKHVSICLAMLCILCYALFSGQKGSHLLVLSIPHKHLGVFFSLFCLFLSSRIHHLSCSVILQHLGICP